MDYHEYREGSVLVIRTGKPLLRGSYVELPSRVAAAFGEGGLTGVVVDLSGADGMDTTGLNALMSVKVVAEAKGARFATCNVCAAVGALMTRLRLNEAIFLHEDLNKAIAYCGGA